jgi:hypothetical protein
VSDEADFIIKRNDSGAAQPLKATLEKLKVDAEGKPELLEGQEQFVPINLSTAASVHMYAKSDARRIKFGAMTLVDKPNGKVEYAFQKAAGEEPADLSKEGTYKLEFEITWADGSVQTVPNDGYLTLEVVEDLGPSGEET